MLPDDPLESARAAGLHYSRNEGPGILRRRSGKGFLYLRNDGTRVRDEADLRRIRSLVIPPAWTGVWIAPSPKAHIQAVGRDARGRKQYRYHPVYRQVRDLTKFGRMLAFVEALPAIRRRTEADLRLPGLPREKVLAAVVSVLESTAIRVGNEEYERANGSFGLTTLKDNHAVIHGSRVRLRFRGKSGQEQDVSFSDRRLARIVRQCRELPGHDLFQYIDEQGSVVDIKSDDVNRYVRDITGQDFTAKDFRTWAGTVLAARELNECGCARSPAEAKRNVVAAIQKVAGHLGNRPATTRKYYVHPAVLDTYLRGLLDQAMAPSSGPPDSGLHPAEACVAALLRTHFTLPPATAL